MDWRSIPSLSSLRAFCAVASSNSLSAAGRELNVTHAAVSQQVRGLEKHLGVALIQREGRGVVLTPEGTVLFEGLKSGFESIQEAVHKVSGADDARPINITTTPSFAVGWLMPRISDFRAKHPDIDLMINPSPYVVPFEPGGVDLAIRYGAGNWPGLEAEMLVHSNYVVVGATCLVGDQETFAPEDLIRFPWLQEFGTNEIALWLERQGVVAPSRLNISHLPGYMILDGVKKGHGITAMAKTFIQSEIEDGVIRVLFEDLRQSTNGYHIVTRPGVQRPAMKAFVKWLRSLKDS
ncbi:LysR family transcriptional regulator [Roseibium denhamense]|uniref:LysR family transcriptional regulator, glycine cleavage system transcriptional activator n=1 Tax=Roseibium denhamense TaxID=76305 RepID=A0ABY1NRZ1_9HYPH|nr:LysR family transcriptional regulator [Roseibium denhamense]MTI08143.1 LysR family transcriptional regulator [Roseibium denhamense]SMP16693.1 LysR family transcriptional regulator, glycine cleavage system transcriptional activator [Roseibium denhamense]